MILIKSIEFYETKMDPIEIVNPNILYKQSLVTSNYDKEYAEVSDLRELIHGRRFRRPSDGTEIVIGVSKQAQDLIGIQYEAWDNMEKQLDSYYRESMKTRSILTKIEKANLLTRLKWIFTGVTKPTNPDKNGV